MEFLLAQLHFTMSLQYLFPKVKTIIDIGGQDSKVIKLDSAGQVADFMMNDKCASGTGRFLETLSTVLGIDVSELVQLAANAKPLPINSMCTVFAESEVVSLLAQGAEKSQIAAGILQSICSRIAGMVNRLGVEKTVIFTGGTAKNSELAKMLAAELKEEVIVPDLPQITGALGAAVIAYNNINNLESDIK